MGKMHPNVDLAFPSEGLLSCSGISGEHADSSLLVQNKM